MALNAIVAIPLLAAILCWFYPLRKAAWVITLVSTWTVLPLTVFVAAKVLSGGRVVGVPGWIEADALSALVLALVSFVICAGGGVCRRIHAAQRA